MMISPWLNDYLANAHCEDLLREARQAALAAKATGATGDWWELALRRAAHMLLKSGRHLNAYLYYRQLARRYRQVGAIDYCHVPAGDTVHLRLTQVEIEPAMCSKE